MKVEYVFFNPVVGHHHLHIRDDADTTIVTEVDVRDVKGQKPYTREQAIDFASQRTDKLAVKKQDVLIAKGIEAITKAVDEVSPEEADKQKYVEDLLKRMSETKAVAEPQPPKNEELIVAGVK